MNNKINGYDFIKNSLNNCYRKSGFCGNTVEEYTQWKKNITDELKEILGFNSFNEVELLPQLLETIEFEKYTREKYIINTMENLQMPFYVLTPKNGNGKTIVAIHGHGCQGKEGLVYNQNEAFNGNMEKFNYSYAFELLERGYRIYVPDLLGAGERTLGIYKDIKTAECNDINNALMSMGMSLQGVMVYELMRLIDYISKKGCNDIGVVGFSGGGHTALWLGALDDRVKYIVSSGFFHSFKDVLIYTNRCGCNFIPKLWEKIDMCDLVALIAPKPLFIELGIKDTLIGERGLDSALEQLEIAQRAYKLFNCKIEFSACEGKHQWYGSCYNWLNNIE